MLLDRYEDQGLLFNRNFKEKPSARHTAYRGELVLQEGEMADAAGRRKPPQAVLRDVVALAADEGMVMLAGVLDDIRQLPLLVERFGADLAPGARICLFVPNAHTSAKVVLGTQVYWIFALAEGMVWTELCDMLALEKSDFKGQSAAEKVETLYQALIAYRPQLEELGLDCMLANATQTRRETRGAL